MKHSELLLNLKGILETNMTTVKGVQVIPHEGKISISPGFPLIGIMDGGDKYEKGKMQKLHHFQVIIVAYQQILSDSPGDAVVGKNGKPGVMDLIEEAVNILEENIPMGFHLVKNHGSTATAPFLVKENKEISFKSARLEYRKQTTGA